MAGVHGDNTLRGRGVSPQQPLDHGPVPMHNAQLSPKSPRKSVQTLRGHSFQKQSNISRSSCCLHLKKQNILQN